MGSALSDGTYLYQLVQAHLINCEADYEYPLDLKKGIRCRKEMIFYMAPVFFFLYS